MSSTGAAAAMFEAAHAKLETFTNELRPSDGQAGAVFAIRGAVVGLDAFDSPQTWARVMPGLIRSYGLDALDATVGGNAFARPEPDRFLQAIGDAPLEAFPSIGLGSDVRVGGNTVVGGALVVNERVMHLLAFPKHEATRPKTRRQREGVQ